MVPNKPTNTGHFSSSAADPNKRGRRIKATGLMTHIVIENGGLTPNELIAMAQKARVQPTQTATATVTRAPGQ